MRERERGGERWVCKRERERERGREGERKQDGQVSNVVFLFFYFFIFYQVFFFACLEWKAFPFAFCIVSPRIDNLKRAVATFSARQLVLESTSIAVSSRGYIFFFRPEEGGCNVFSETASRREYVACSA